MEKVYKWQLENYRGLDAEKIAAIIEACRIAHSGFISIGLACGIRAAFRVLLALDAERDRHGVESAEIRANGCAALAFTVICCISPYKEQVSFRLYDPPDWEATACSQTQKVHIKMAPCDFRSVEEVFEAPDDKIFASVEVSAL